MKLGNAWKVWTKPAQGTARMGRDGEREGVVK